MGIALAFGGDRATTSQKKYTWPFKQQKTRFPKDYSVSRQSWIRRPRWWATPTRRSSSSSRDRATSRSPGTPAHAKLDRFIMPCRKKGTNKVWRIGKNIRGEKRRWEIRKKRKWMGGGEKEKGGNEKGSKGERRCWEENYRKTAEVRRWKKGENWIQKEGRGKLFSLIYFFIYSQIRRRKATYVWPPLMGHQRKDFTHRRGENRGGGHKKWFWRGQGKDFKFNVTSLDWHLAVYFSSILYVKKLNSDYLQGHVRRRAEGPERPAIPHQDQPDHQSQRSFCRGINQHSQKECDFFTR